MAGTDASGNDVTIQDTTTTTSNRIDDVEDDTTQSPNGTTADDAGDEADFDSVATNVVHEEWSSKVPVNGLMTSIIYDKKTVRSVTGHESQLARKGDRSIIDEYTGKESKGSGLFDAGNGATYREQGVLIPLLRSSKKIRDWLSIIENKESCPLDCPPLIRPRLSFSWDRSAAVADG